jgi:hypothetical protein
MSTRSLVAVAWVVFALLVATLALVTATVAIVATRPAPSARLRTGSMPQLAGGLGGATNPSYIAGPLAEFPAQGVVSAALTRQQLRGHTGSDAVHSERLPGSAGGSAGARVVDSAGAAALIRGPDKSVLYVMQSRCPACVRTKAALQRMPPALLSRVAILDVSQWEPVAHLLKTNAVPQAFVVGKGTVERGAAGAPSSDAQLQSFLRTATAA